MKQETIRTSLDIPAPLHRRLHEAAARRALCARQLIYLARSSSVAEESRSEDRRVVAFGPAKGRRIRPVTNDEALFS
jgi:hypothetical protein